MCHQLEGDMEKILKKDFCLLLAVKPHSVIGKEITLKDGNFVKILDVALGGNYLSIRGFGPDPTWIGVDVLADEFIIDSSPATNTFMISAKLYEQLDERVSKYFRGGRRST